MIPTCIQCGDTYPAARHNLGYATCLDCGDRAARQVRFTVMPAYSKGAYQLVSRADIAHTNPKGTHS
jgi:predicted  nucleic acid-binding Zn-ribbon protein